MRRDLTKLVMRLLPLLLLLAAAPTLTATANSDWERAKYATYLAERLKLYEDGLAWTSAIEDESQRAIARASVYRIWSENLTGKARKEKRAAALTELEAINSNEGKIAHARMRLDFIEADGFDREMLDVVKNWDEEDPAFAVQAKASIYNRLKAVKTAMLDDAFIHDERYSDQAWVTTLIESFQLMLRTSYTAIRMMPDLTQAERDERTAVLGSMRTLFNEMRFEREAAGYFPVPFFDAFFILGDTQHALGNFDFAVQQYLEVKDILAEFSASNPTVSYQSLRAVVRAVDVLMNDFGNEAAKIKHGRDLIAEAFTRFPLERKSAQGRQLKLLDVQASLKLGEDVNTALAELLAMARDSSSGLFQARAATALGDVAQLPALSIEQRTECVKAIMAINSLKTNQIAIMVMHSVLASIDDEKAFEAYAPFCYASIGQIYEAQGRFYEAATIFLEGSQRFAYWRNNHTEWNGSTAKLPAYFYDAAGKPIFTPLAYSGTTMSLATQGDAFDFCKHLAARAAANAGYLNSKKYGATNIDAFKSLQREVDEWNANFLGKTALYRMLQKEGNAKYSTNRLLSGYILMNTLPQHGSAQSANYYAGLVFADYFQRREKNLSDAEWGGLTDRVIEQVLVGDGEFNLQGVETTASEIVFTSHLARVESDFAPLPAWVLELIRKDIQDTAHVLKSIVKNNNDERAWALSIYCLRRSAYFGIAEDARRLPEMLATMQTPGSFADAIMAWSTYVNQNGILTVPKVKREPDAKMLNMAKVFNYLYYMLKVEASKNADQNKALRAGLDEQAVEIGGVTLKAFRPHLEAAIELLSNPEFTDDSNAKLDADQSEVMLKSFIRGEFDHFVAERRPSQALDSMAVYRDRFFNGTKGAERATEGRNVFSMVAALYIVMSDEQSPRARVRRDAARALDGLIFRLHDGRLTSPAMFKVSDKDPSASLAKIHGAALESLRSGLLEDLFDGSDPEKGRILGGLSLKTYIADLPARRAAFVQEFDRLVTKYRGLQASKLSELCGAWATDKLYAAVTGDLGRAQALSNQGKPYEAYALIAAAVVGKDVYARSLDGKAAAVFNYYGDGVGLAFQGELAQFLDQMATQYRSEAGDMYREFLTVSEALDTYREYSSNPKNASSDDPEITFTYARYTDSVAQHLKTSTEWWQKGYTLWNKYLEHLRMAGKLKDVAFIDLDVEKHQIVDDAELAREFEVRFSLGRAASRVWALSNFQDQAAYVVARDNLRRVFNIAQWRIGVNKNMIDKRWFQNLKDSETFSRVDGLIHEVTIEYQNFGDLHIKNKIKANWGGQSYWRQDVLAITKADAEAKPEGERLWQLPETPVDWLRDSDSILNRIAMSFGEKGGIFNAYHRDLTLEWVKRSKWLLELGGYDKVNNTANTPKEQEACARLVVSYTRSDFEMGAWALDGAAHEFVGEIGKILNEIVAKLPADNLTRLDIEGFTK